MGSRGVIAYLTGVLWLGFRISWLSLRGTDAAELDFGLVSRWLGYKPEKPTDGGFWFSQSRSTSAPLMRNETIPTSLVASSIKASN